MQNLKVKYSVKSGRVVTNKNTQVWDEENEETEDAEETIDNEFETDSEGEEGE